MANPDVIDDWLEPCPFCGSKAEMKTFTTAMEKKPRYTVRCTGKDCRVSLDWDWWSIETAKEAWNRRGRQMSITIRTTHDKSLQLPTDRRKLPKDLSDRELTAKLCRNVAGGCQKCESLEFCQFGKEHLRREENRE